MICECLNLRSARIAQLVNEGMPKEARGKYDLAKCVRWFLDYKLKSGPSVAGDVNAARKALYIEQTETAKLNNARLKRESIPSDEHMIDMNQLAVLFAGGLDTLEGRLPHEIIGMGDAAMIADIVRRETGAIRESVADAILSYSHTVSANESAM